MHFVGFVIACNRKMSESEFCHTSVYGILSCAEKPSRDHCCFPPRLAHNTSHTHVVGF